MPVGLGAMRVRTVMIVIELSARSRRPLAASPACASMSAAVASHSGSAPNR
jgi:hypothetical protein